MTKVDAIKKLMQDNNGLASWEYIYQNIEYYYPDAKNSKDWSAGLRGVLYRDIGKNFKKIGLGVFSLVEYDEKKQIQEIQEDKVRMHSYMEGILIELGNFEKYTTFCADKSSCFQGNMPLNQLTRIDSVPDFTYQAIIDIVKRIDVIWFSGGAYSFPRRASEVVDSIGTLGDAINRMYQLIYFDTDLYIVAPKEYKSKIEKRLNCAPYIDVKKRFVFKDYDEVLKSYNATLEREKHRF